MTHMHAHAHMRLRRERARAPPNPMRAHPMHACRTHACTAPPSRSRRSCARPSMRSCTPQPACVQTDSHESAMARGRSEIAALVEQLRITPSMEAIEAAHRLYKLAMQRGFTRGRRVDQVRATVPFQEAKRTLALQRGRAAQQGARQPQRFSSDLRHVPPVCKRQAVDALPCTPSLPPRPPPPNRWRPRACTSTAGRTRGPTCSSTFQTT